MMKRTDNYDALRNSPTDGTSGESVKGFTTTKRGIDATKGTHEANMEDPRDPNEPTNEHDNDGGTMR